MLHQKRVWAVSEVASPEELAEKLTSMTWCLCNGFKLDGMLFLNDATSENGAQEYAIVRELDYQQIESVTFSWIDQPQALKIIRAAVENRLSDAGYGQIPFWNLQDHSEHGRCRLCA